MNDIKITNEDIVLQVSVIRDRIKELRKNISSFIRYTRILDDSERKELHRVLEYIARDLKMDSVIVEEANQRIMLLYNDREILRKLKDL